MLVGIEMHIVNTARTRDNLGPSLSIPLRCPDRKITLEPRKCGRSQRLME
jgi:hypothetical protein